LIIYIHSNKPEEIIVIKRILPLTAIRSFESAARHESYVKAGQELHVTPTAISQQVSLLEGHLEIKLFVRLANRLKLTSAGAMLLPELTAGFELISNAADKVRKERLQGIVTIGILPAMAMNWLIPKLGDFSAQFPDLHLSLHTSPDLDFVTEDVDIKIRYFDGKGSKDNCHFLCDEEVFPVCSPSMLQKNKLYSVADIKHFPLIHDIDGQRNQSWLGWHQWLSDVEIETHPGFEFRDSMSVMHAAVNGLGIALGRSALLGNLLSTGQLVAPLKEKKKAGFSYYIEVKNENFEEKNIQVVIDWLMGIV
jgi:LysR family glycine cleavage system transcriptional activator